MGLWDRVRKGESKTLKPVKKHNTSKRTTLSAHTKRTLGSGNLRAAVTLPPDEDLNEWMAANTVDFYNEISLLYGICLDDAKQYTKPGSGFPPGYQYLWSNAKGEKPIQVSGPEYVDYVMTWVEAQIENEEIFPVLESQEFPPDFMDYIRDLYKKLFRVFTIIYHRHFKAIEEATAAPHLNTAFKHFMFFCYEFDLVPAAELKPMAKPCAKLKDDFDKLV